MNETEKSNSWSSDEQGFVGKREVARATGASLRSVDNWIAEKKIPVIRISARCIRFHLPSVLQALRRFEIREVSRPSGGEFARKREVASEVATP